MLQIKADPSFNLMVKKTNENARIFTDVEKDKIADFIFDNIITTG